MNLPLFTARRLAALILVVLVVSSLLFVLIRLSGDPIQVLAPPEASPEALEKLRLSLGLRDPLLVQYVRFLSSAVRLDFGVSFRSSRPAIDMIVERLPASLSLALSAFALTVIVAFPLGIFVAIRQRSPSAYMVLMTTFVLQAMPAFWLGVLLIFVFSVRLHVLPSFGAGTISHYVLPSVTLAGFMLAKTSRFVRATLIEVLRQQFIQVARAKGLQERAVVLSHALKNALIPVVTVLSLDITALVGGAVVTETIFAWPGLGRLLVQAAASRDYPVVQAAVFLITLMVVLVNLFAEIAYRYLDPRIGWE